MGGEGIQRMGSNNKISPSALTLVTVGRAGITALTAQPPGQQVEQMEELILPGAGA